MARHRDELQRMLPHRSRQGRAADPGHGAINDAAVLVADDGPAGRRTRDGLCEQARETDAELLPGGQDMKRPQPRRRRREADAGEQGCDLLDRHRVGEVVEDGTLWIPLVLALGFVRPEGAGDGGLAAAGRPGDEADGPGPFFQRQVYLPAERASRVGREVEQAGDLRDARRRSDRGTYGNVGVHGSGKNRASPKRQARASRTRPCLALRARRSLRCQLNNGLHFNPSS